ncbi:MAG: TRAP transporter small permease [Bacillota bacterium]
MKVLKFLVCNIEELITAIFLVVMTVLVSINVFLRYVMNTGIVWSEEFATACFVWAVFIGAAACYKKKAHVGVDMLVNQLPAFAQKIVGIVVNIILLVFNSYLTYLTWLYLQTSYTKTTPVMQVSSAYISSSIFVAFALMTMYTVIFLVQDFIDLFSGTKGEVEAVTLEKAEATAEEATARAETTATATTEEATARAETTATATTEEATARAETTTTTETKEDEKGGVQ